MPVVDPSDASGSPLMNKSMLCIYCDC